jgi:exopolysaccharide biosynthesis polyprenyl glycosylphosphotransferase
MHQLIHGLIVIHGYAFYVSKTVKLGAIVFLLDLSSILIGIYASYHIRFVSKGESLGNFLFLEGESVLIFIALSWITFLLLSDLYQNSTIAAIKIRIVLFMKYSLSFIAIIGLTSFVSKSNLSRLLVLYSLIATVFLNSIFRFFASRLIAHRFHWRNSFMLKGVVVSRSKNDIRSALDWLRGTDNSALSIPKFLKCEGISLEWLEEFERLRNLFPIDYVIISPSLLQEERIGELINYLHDLRLEVFMIPLTSKATGFWLNPRESECSPFLQFESGRKQTLKLSIKRLFDFLFASLIILFLVPVFILISLMLLYFDGRPIFYISKRVGKNGNSFGMFKFRTMYVESEQKRQTANSINNSSNFIFKDKDDPRVTKLGKCLRKYSLDELPQFFNVLIGNMSVVGPRPFPPYEVSGFDSLYLRRLDCKPGVTGPWQISGRSNLNLSDSKGLDLEYANNWSLTGDILIIAKTIPAVLKKSGAY